MEWTRIASEHEYYPGTYTEAIEVGFGGGCLVRVRTPPRTDGMGGSIALTFVPGVIIVDGRLVKGH